jgi:crotonobetainyl-CoA:carnitine CoA-transferase CaiB-like acyl-CoA transferase
MGLLGSADLLETPDYHAAKAEGRHMPVIYSEIARKTPAKTTAEWLALFAVNDIPAMAVRDLEDIKDDPHLVATGFFRRRAHPDVGAFHEMQPPVKYGAMPPRDLGFAPRVDGDGAAIRGELSCRT